MKHYQQARRADELEIYPTVELQNVNRRLALIESLFNDPEYRDDIADVAVAHGYRLIITGK